MTAAVKLGDGHPKCLIRSGFCLFGTTTNEITTFSDPSPASLGAFRTDCGSLVDTSQKKKKSNKIKTLASQQSRKKLTHRLRKVLHDLKGLHLSEFARLASKAEGSGNYNYHRPMRAHPAWCSAFSYRSSSIKKVADTDTKMLY